MYMLNVCVLISNICEYLLLSFDVFCVKKYQTCLPVFHINAFSMLYTEKAIFRTWKEEIIKYSQFLSSKKFDFML